MKETEKIRALEFFSGIGGFAASVDDRDDFELVGAFEISPHCVSAYRLNWSHPVSQVDLLSSRVEIPEADLWWMSAPCTPFSRRGGQLDLRDHRSEPLVVMCDRVQERKPNWVVIENVEGFVGSGGHELFRMAVSDYNVWEDVVCPTDLGVPNKRPRFYSIASRTPFSPPVFNPVVGFNLQTLFLQTPGDLVSDRVVSKYGRVMHRVSPDAEYLTCFTGSYGKSWVYSGSFLQSTTGTRLFSPEQVAMVMGLPKMVWPEGFSMRQKYKYLGNSLSVWVVRELMKAVVV